MNKQIKLKDWLSGNCQYKGCLHNSNGICEYEDEDFVEELLNIMKYTYKNNREISGSTYFTCNNFDIESDEYCEWCGEKLTEKVDRLPYGDTSVPFTYLECDNC